MVPQVPGVPMVPQVPVGPSGTERVHVCMCFLRFLGFLWFPRFLWVPQVLSVCMSVWCSVLVSLWLLSNSLYYQLHRTSDVYRVSCSRG